MCLDGWRLDAHTKSTERWEFPQSPISSLLFLRTFRSYRAEPFEDLAILGSPGSGEEYERQNRRLAGGGHVYKILRRG